MPTSSASHPNDIEYIQGDTDKVFFGEGTGGSRSATMSGSAFYMAGEKVDRPRPRRSPRTMLKVDVDDVKFDDGIFSSTKTNQTMTIKDVAQDVAQSGEAAEEHGGRPRSPPRSTRPTVENFPNGCHVCEVEIDPETGKIEVVNYNVVDDVGTVINPLLLQGPDRRRRGDGRRPDSEGGHPLRRAAASSSPARSWTTPCRAPTTSRRSRSKANPVPTKTNPLGVKGAGEAGCVGAMPAVANALVDALVGVRHQAHRDAGDAGAGVAGDPRGAGEKRVTTPGSFTDC